MENKYKQSFSFIFILNYLGVSVPEEATPLINFSFGVFILALLTLFCYLNALISLLSLYILSKYNVDEKFKNYPRIIKIIKYYENTSLFSIFIEIISGFIFLLIIIFGSLGILGIFTYFKIF